MQVVAGLAGVTVSDAESCCSEREILAGIVAEVSLWCGLTLASNYHLN